MLILKNVYKKYDSSKKYVLKNINLSFSDQGLVCILGESGSGKTTLLNLIAGIDRQTEGQIYIDRTCIDKLKKENSLYNQYIGLVFQNYNLIDYLNVEDNVRLLSKNKVATVLRKLNMRDKEKRSIKSLSGGQMQRVAIARTIVNDKKIILCDEPTGALDHDTSLKIMEVLKRLSKERLVIVVTHNEDLAKKYATRIIRIKDGVVNDDTNPHNIKERKRIYYYKNNKESKEQLLRQVIKNLFIQKKKNLIRGISLFISLISLLLILTISSGFNSSIEIAEKDELSRMPIYISKTSTNIKNELNDLFKEKKVDEKLIYSKDTFHINNIDRKLIDYIDNIENKYNIIKNISVNNIVLSIYSKNIDDDIELLLGDTPNKKSELLLIIDSNNSIDKSILEFINIRSKRIEINKLVDYKVNKKYKISGIAKFKEESPMYDNTGLYTISHNQLPNEILIYPNNYNNKKEIIKYLDNYKDLEYMDYSDTAVSVSKTIITSISIILSVFSIISIIITSLMNYILTFITVEESIKTIGIYIVNGITKRTIKLIYYLENIIVSIFSALISIGTIYILSIPINKILSSMTGLNHIMNISPSIIITSFSLAITITLISTFIPLKKIDRLKLVDIIKYN